MPDRIPTQHRAWGEVIDELLREPNTGKLRPLLQELNEASLDAAIQVRETSITLLAGMPVKFLNKII